MQDDRPQHEQPSPPDGKKSIVSLTTINRLVPQNDTRVHYFIVILKQRPKPPDVSGHRNATRRILRCNSPAAWVKQADNAKKHLEITAWPSWNPNSLCSFPLRHLITPVCAHVACVTPFSLADGGVRAVHLPLGRPHLSGQVPMTVAVVALEAEGSKKSVGEILCMGWKRFSDTNTGTREVLYCKLKSKKPVIVTLWKNQKYLEKKSWKYFFHVERSKETIKKNFLSQAFTIQASEG